MTYKYISVTVKYSCIQKLTKQNLGYEENLKVIATNQKNVLTLTIFLQLES